MEGTVTDVPKAHDTLRDDLAEALAELMTKQRTHGAVYMGGEHNPLPSEMQAARLFIRDVVLQYADAQVAAERQRIAADLRTCSLLAGTAGNSARAAAFETAAEIVESEPEPAGEQP
jgi:hypothetical protein